MEQNTKDGFRGRARELHREEGRRKPFLPRGVFGGAQSPRNGPPNRLLSGKSSNRKVLCGGWPQAEYHYNLIVIDTIGGVNEQGVVNTVNYYMLSQLNSVCTTIICGGKKSSQSE